MSAIWKKWLAIGAAGILCMSSVMGCSNQKKETDQTSNQQPLGRYVEKDMELPKQTIGSDGIGSMGMYTDLDGMVKLYFQQGVNKAPSIYTVKGETLEEVDVPFTLPKNQMVNNIQQGGDGKLYLCLIDATTLKTTFYEVDGENLIEYPVEHLNQLEHYDTGDSFYPNVIDWEMMPDQSLVELEYAKGSWISKDGTVKNELPGAYVDGYVARIEEKAAILSNEQSGISIYEQGKEEAAQTIELPSGGSPFLSGTQDGTLLAVNQTGLHLLQKGGSKWETIFESNGMSMGLPTYSISSVKEGNDGDYYILYLNDKTYELKHYVYDETVASEPSTTLTIYSLEQMAGIQQAAVLFEKEHPDVKVDYRVALENDSITVSDAIKALNTELLSGKGADILITESLPVDSYIEKGILLDLTDFIMPMEEDGTLNKNIIEACKRDGKLYTVPQWFIPYFFAGSNDTLSHTKSLEQLTEYAKTLEKPLFGTIDYNTLFWNLFHIYGEEMYEEDGSVTEQSVQQFLELVKEISKYNTMIDELDYRDAYQVYPMIGVLNEANQLGLEYISDETGLMVATYLMKSGKVEVGTANGIFISSNTMAINASSNYTDLAKEFIQVALSEKAQKLNLSEGYPVNEKAMDGMYERDEKNYISVSFETEKGIVDLSWPDKKEQAEFLDLTRSVNKMEIQEEEEVAEKLSEEVVSYLKGEQELEKTAQNIVRIYEMKDA